MMGVKIPPMKLMSVVLAVSMMSCNENRVFEEHTDPSGNLEWKRDQVIKYDIEIIDTSIKYNIYLALRFANGYAFKICDVEVSETAPDGLRRIEDFRFTTRDEQGYTGDGAGDIFDLESIWRQSYAFPSPGTYHYEIRHIMPDDLIHMVMEVGLIVDKAVGPK